MQAFIKTCMAYIAYRDMLLADISPGCPSDMRDVMADNNAMWSLWDDGVTINDALVRLHYEAACRKANRDI